MRGELMYKILDSLEEKSMDMSDFLVAFLSAGYGASASKIDYKYKKLQNESQRRILVKNRKRSLQKYISKLKSQNLISEDSMGMLSLSLQGKNKLSSWEENKILNKDNYQKQAGNRVIIISYDIPVPFNKERDILRGILQALGFELIHKSVWVGKVVLPKQFITALDKLKILKFIEILEVTKSGTLKEIN